jgi:hypothetical protein
LEQELAHDVALDLQGDRFEVVNLLLNNSSPVVLPKVLEVGFDAVSKLDGDVGGALLLWVVFYFFY